MTTHETCPHQFDPFSANYLQDPYSIVADLREAEPFFDSDLDMWIISRYQDIKTIFGDPDTFSAANAQEPIFAMSPEALAILATGFKPIKTMSNLDGPEHTRIRKHNQIGFSPRRLRMLEPVVRQTAIDLIQPLQELGDEESLDLVEALTHPMPASIIFALLGFPEEDTSLLKSWCGDRMSFSWGKPSSEQQVAIAHDMVEYWQYCEQHIQRRLAEPGDDFTSDLLAIHIADPQTLSLHEITHVVYGLSFAGHETTTNLMSNTIRRCLEDQSIWQSISQDPSVIAGVVDEGLRHDSSVIAWRRITTKPVNIGKTKVPSRAKLLLLLGAANHDSFMFKDPDRFIPDRANASRHLSLGFGKHFCLGAPLAKLEIAVVLEELSASFPDLSLVSQELSFHPNISFRGPETLRVSSQRPD